MAHSFAFVLMDLWRTMENVEVKYSLFESKLRRTWSRPKKNNYKPIQLQKGYLIVRPYVFTKFERRVHDTRPLFWAFQEYLLKGIFGLAEGHL